MRAHRSDVTEAPAIGSAIDVNTKSYDRIFGMLLGIRIHVSQISAKPDLGPPTGSDFTMQERIEIPREGNHTAPAHKGNYDYKFKTYAPKVFRKLRHHFGITDDEYLMSITADYMMSQLKTIGRSSAMFYYTWDGRYVLKTLTKEEMHCLLEILPQYYRYVMSHTDTLVNHFFGAYRSQTSMGRPIRFVIMNNVFPIGFQIHYKFDLKGSVVNRQVSEEKRQHPGSTWKEAEFQAKRYLQIGPRDWARLKTQLMDDTNFLSNVGVMDYSLLIGIHKFNPDSPIMHPAPGEKIEILSVFTPDQSSRSRYGGNSVIVKKIQKKGKAGKKQKVEPTVKSTLNMVEQNIRQYSAIIPGGVTDEHDKLLSYCGGLRGSNEHDEPLAEIYYMGIIDFLQGYGMRKKAEHLFKSAFYGDDAMSCIAPSKYANRMFTFLTETIGPEHEIPPEELERLEQRRMRLVEMSRPREEGDTPVLTDGQVDETNKKEKKKEKKEKKAKEKKEKKEKKAKEKKEKEEQKKKEKEEKKKEKEERKSTGIRLSPLKRRSSEIDPREIPASPLVSKPAGNDEVLENPQ